MSPDPIPTPDQMQRWMRVYHVTTRMLAEALGYGQDHTRRMVTGKRRVMPETAPRLVAYFQERRAAITQDRAAIHDLDIAA